MFSLRCIQFAVKSIDVSVLRFVELYGCSVVSVHNYKRKCWYSSSFSNVLTHSEKKNVPVPINIMFSVVNDVDRYEEFVPWCTESSVMSRSKNTAKAKLTVGFGPIQEHYKSTLIFNEPKYIKSICSDGKLFNMLDCTWKFSNTPDSLNTTILFDVTFEFRSIMYTKLAQVFFDEVVKKMVSAFEKRAIQKHKEQQKLIDN